MRATIMILTAGILTAAAWGQTTQPAPAPATQPTEKVPAGDGNAGTEAYREFLAVAACDAHMTPEQRTAHKAHVDAFMARLPAKVSFNFEVMAVLESRNDSNWRLVRFVDLWSPGAGGRPYSVGAYNMVLAPRDVPEGLGPRAVLTVEGTPELRTNRSFATDANEERLLRAGANFVLAIGDFRHIVFRDCQWKFEGKTGTPLPVELPRVKRRDAQAAVSKGQPAK